MEICTVAERVAKSQDLTLNGAKLNVELLRAGRPPTLVAAGDDMYLNNTFVFIDLPRVDAYKLQQYAEKVARTDVEQFIFSCTTPSSALVVYTADPGTDAVFSF